MLARIEVNDTLIENAGGTLEAEVNPPEPLKVRFFCGNAVSVGYMNYETGLLNLMTGICKNNRMVRKLKVVVELENDETGGSADGN